MDVISYYVSCESGNDRVIFQFQRKIYDCHHCTILWGFDIPTDSTLEFKKKIARKTKLDIMYLYDILTLLIAIYMNIYVHINYGK